MKRDVSLAPCPTCQRHVRLRPNPCPFCGADTASAVPGRVRVVSRREITRAAVFAVGAVVLSACGSRAESDESAGGGDTSGGDEADPAPNDTVASEHTAVSDDETTDTDDSVVSDAVVSDETVVADDAVVADDTVVSDESDDAVVHDELELRRRYEERRHRQLPQCVSDGTCAAPPYGAPPAETIV